jgi:hypothetical protein
MASHCWTRCANTLSSKEIASGGTVGQAIVSSKIIIIVAPLNSFCENSCGLLLHGRTALRNEVGKESEGAGDS